MSKQLTTNKINTVMKKLGMMMAAAMILAGTATYANSVKPAHIAKAKTFTVVAHQEVKHASTPAKPATAADTHKKAHKKHPMKKAAVTTAPKTK
jgi:hypothetical protein